MKQSDGGARRWWLANWIFHGPDGRNARRATLWTVAFGILLMIGGLGYGPVETGEFRTFSGWRWVLTLAPVVPGVVAIFAWQRFIANAEELLKRICTEAAAFALSVALVLFPAIYIGARVFGEAQAANANLLVFTIVLVTFLFGVQHRLRKFDA